MNLKKAKSKIQYENYISLNEFHQQMMNNFNGIYKYNVCSVYFLDENKFDFYFIFYVRYENDLDKIYIKIPKDIKDSLECTYTNIYNFINKEITKNSLNIEEKHRLNNLIDQYFHEKFFADNSLYKEDDYEFENKNVLLQIISENSDNPYADMFNNCTVLNSIPTPIRNMSINSTNIYKGI